MNKIYQNIALIIVALTFSWFFLTPPYIDVSFTDDRAEVTFTYMDRFTSKLVQVEIWDIHDSLIWKAVATDEAMQIPSLTLSLGANHKNLGMSKDMLSTLTVQVPEQDSLQISQGQYIRVVIKKPGYGNAWFGKLYVAELEFKTAEIVTP